MREDEDPQPDDPVELPIDGTLDLHSFLPRDVPSVVAEYLDACRERGIFHVRIVHGKGIGVLRETVHAVLARRDDVESYRLDSQTGSGWGATLVELRRPSGGDSRTGDSSRNPRRSGDARRGDDPGGSG